MALEETGLQPFLFRRSYDNAVEILQHLEGIAKAPGGKTSTFMVASHNRNKDPYTVCLQASGAIICRCEMFASRSLCSHTLSVTDHQKMLPRLLAWYVSVNK